MTDYLETTLDKFIFRVATDRDYSPRGHLVPGTSAADRIRVGLTDFLQQHSGDVAFATVKPAGTSVAAGDELRRPGDHQGERRACRRRSRGTIVEVNAALELHPELVNQDPYGEGWLAVIEAPDWDAERGRPARPGGLPRGDAGAGRAGARPAMSDDERTGRHRAVQRHRQAVRLGEPRGRLRAVRRAPAGRDPTAWRSRSWCSGTPEARAPDRGRPRHHHRRLQAHVRREARRAERRHVRPTRWPVLDVYRATRTSSPKASPS